jgi:hypothetical protein
MKKLVKEAPIYVWKKCLTARGVMRREDPRLTVNATKEDIRIVKLEIEPDAVVYDGAAGKFIWGRDLRKAGRCDPFVLAVGGRKMRSTRAKVIRVEALGGRKRLPANERVAFAMFDTDFVYMEGHEVQPRRPYATEKVKCASGIHFYPTREEAERH